jgi:tetratricopeptide (TPR) repeat protein
MTGSSIGRRREGLAACVGAAVIAAVVFLPTLSFEFTNWDDVDYVMANPVLVSGKIGRLLDPDVTTADAWTPITIASYAVERALVGLDPWLYHATNVALHAACAALVAAVLLGTGLPPLGAFVGAALFAVHPLQVESVAWVSGRKNPLSTLFLLAALLAFRGAGWRAALWGTALGALALLSKPTAVVLAPLVLLDRLRARAFAGRPAIERRDLVALAPIFVFSLAIGLLAADQQGDARADIAREPFIVRALTMGKVAGQYADHLVLPTDLSAHYPVRPASPGDATAIATLFGVFALFGLGAWRLRRDPTPLFLLAWIPLSAFPHLNLIAGPFWMADRYAYVPLVGVAGLVGLGAGRLWPRLPRAGRGAAAVAAAVVVIALGLASIERSRVWRTSFSLWDDTLARVPDFFEGHLNLGTAYALDGRHEEAAAAYRRCLEIRPHHADAHVSLGNELDALGRRAEATPLYEHALRLDGKSWAANYNLAIIFQEDGRLEDAKRLYEYAVTLDADSWLTWNNLGTTYRDLGQTEAAMGAYRRALDANPAYAPAWINLGDTLRRMGRPAEAERAYLRASEADPSLARPHYSLAILYAARGDLLLARTRLLKALEIEPDLAIAGRSLAIVEERLREAETAP